MKIKVKYTETTEWTCVVEEDEAEFLAWVNEGQPPTDPPITLADVDSRTIKDWLTSGRETEKQVVDRGSDYEHVSEHIEIDGGEVVTD